jgi:hypothetical protein
MAHSRRRIAALPMILHGGRRSRVALVLAVTFTLAGCSGGADGLSAGPLKYEGGSVTQCASVPKGGSMLVGDVATAPKGEDVTITNVHLRNPRGISLTRGYMLPVDPAGAIGTSVYPPEDDKAWSHRKPAKSAVLHAGKSGNLVLLLKKTSSANATADALIITYSIDGRNYAKPGTMKYELETDCR